MFPERGEGYRVEVNPDDLEKLTYRGLAERLGISPDAARMKAKRKAKTGGWRIIPGNHPNDAVLVEVPTAELNSTERVGRKRDARSGGERTPRTPEPERANALAEQALASLADAQARVRDLTDQLIETKNAHRRDAAELAAAEMRELGTKAELERALVDIAGLRDQLDQARRSWWQKVWG